MFFHHKLNREITSRLSWLNRRVWTNSQPSPNNTSIHETILWIVTFQWLIVIFERREPCSTSDFQRRRCCRISSSRANLSNSYRLMGKRLGFFSLRLVLNRSKISLKKDAIFRVAIVPVTSPFSSKRARPSTLDWLKRCVAPATFWTKKLSGYTSFSWSLGWSFIPWCWTWLS